MTTEALEEAKRALELAGDDYERKARIPVVGLFYSMPAWRRYLTAFNRYDRTFCAWWFERTGQRLQTISLR